jgi:hypothetical protein
VTPQRSLGAPQWSDIRWKGDEVKLAQLKLYFGRFEERPTAASTLEEIGWSQRSAEKWMPRIWGGHRSRPLIASRPQGTRKPQATI